MTAEISQEAVDRAIALIRDYVAACAHCTVSGQFLTEARAIVAMLPVEVSPDEAEVRAILIKYYNEHGFASLAYHAAVGHDSDDFQVGMLILARGRELAKARAGEGSV